MEIEFDTKQLEITSTIGLGSNSFRLIGPKIETQP